ncbi:MAG: nickel pincer cofactor biosynthesis protein LarB, partial [Lachnospiraceae bacterium]|nr:nickel pincer cofactor biosynthesis protein LarB [Lachnospiraceae bacterium]
MEQSDIYRLLQQVADGTRTPEEAMKDIRMQPDMLVGNYADIDLHRNMRQGMPEVIYGEGKTPDQITGIIRAMTDRGVKNIMITRLSQEKMEQVKEKLTGNPETGESPLSETLRTIPFTYDQTSRIGIANPEEMDGIGKIVVVAAGTSDLPVAEEAAITAQLYGSRVERVYDVGVAGLHRLLHRLPVLEDANAIVAVAGMEGALVSVIGGLVACPVIGVPTSVGYGANFGGLAALLSMLNSCASGVSVVNIDNGFGAGVVAARINRQA